MAELCKECHLEDPYVASLRGLGFSVKDSRADRELEAAERSKR